MALEVVAVAAEAFEDSVGLFGMIAAVEAGEVAERTGLDIQ